MASDFTYDGIENNQCGFTEKATGMKYWLPAPDPRDSAVTLLEDDEVKIPSRYSQDVWFDSGPTHHAQRVGVTVDDAPMRFAALGPIGALVALARLHGYLVRAGCSHSMSSASDG